MRCSWLLALAVALTACQIQAPATVDLKPLTPVAPEVGVSPPARTQTPPPIRVVPEAGLPPLSEGPRPFLPASTLPTAPRARPDAPAALSDAWLVRLAPGATTAATLAALTGFEVRGELQLGGRTLLKMKAPAMLDAATVEAALAGAPGVTFVAAEPVRHRQDFDFTHPDPFLGSQWAHAPNRGNTTGAWALVPAALQSRIVVAILDTGLDVDHPEFAGRVVSPVNFSAFGTATDVTDGDGHGTHVAGIVAAAGDNDAGVAGVAWGVGVMPVKVLGDDGSGTDFDILSGFLRAIRWRPMPDDGRRVRVLNLSLGSPEGAVKSMWIDAVAEATAAGVLVVAAAGNEGTAVVDAPANTPGVLAVGSTNTYLAWEDVSPFSNWGDRLDLVAPGEDILSTVPVFGSALGVNFAYSSGTSMASPYAAGVAALVIARYDGANAHLDATFTELVRIRLLRSVTDLGIPGRDPHFGEGRLDAARAVTPASLEALP